LSGNWQRAPSAGCSLCVCAQCRTGFRDAAIYFPQCFGGHWPDTGRLTSSKRHWRRHDKFFGGSAGI
jgi:hypothetical protein